MDPYYKNLPKKPMGAGALFFDDKNRLLIVKPTYHDWWLIPGGSVDENESPLDCCAREVEEEIGLKFAKEDLRLAVIDYMYKTIERPESLQFVFYGGVLSQEQIEKIVIPKAELAEFKFVEIAEALILVSARMSRRLKKTLENIGKNAVYLENGE